MLCSLGWPHVCDPSSSFSLLSAGAQCHIVAAITDFYKNIFLDVFILFYMCLAFTYVCACTVYMLGAYRGQKTASDPQELWIYGWL